MTTFAELPVNARVFDQEGEVVGLVLAQSPDETAVQFFDDNVTTRLRNRWRAYPSFRRRHNRQLVLATAPGLNTLRRI